MYVISVKCNCSYTSKYLFPQNNLTIKIVEIIVRDIVHFLGGGGDGALFSRNLGKIYTALFCAWCRMKNVKIIGRRCLLSGQQLRSAGMNGKRGRRAWARRVEKRYPNKNGVFISEYPMYHAIFTYTPRLQSPLYIYVGLPVPLPVANCRRRDVDQCIYSRCNKN